MGSLGMSDSVAHWLHSVRVSHTPLQICMYKRDIYFCNLRLICLKLSGKVWPMMCISYHSEFKCISTYLTMLDSKIIAVRSCSALFCCPTYLLNFCCLGILHICLYLLHTILFRIDILISIFFSSVTLVSYY